MTDNSSDETETPERRTFSSDEQNDQDFSSISRGNSDGWRSWHKVTPSVQTNLLHYESEDIHETMIEAVKDFDESGSHSTGIGTVHSTGIRIVTKIENGPCTYTVTSYDGDPEIKDELKNNGDVNIAKSEEDLEDIEERRRYTIGISQEVKEIPATSRYMAMVKAGSEYQRDRMKVAGIRLIGKEEKDGDTYYNVSFESHPEVESQFNKSD
jgi:hypothetical protein